MKRTASLLASLLFSCMANANEDNKSALQLQFSGQAGEPEWVAVNDGVMGGLSRGGPAIKDGLLRFTGTLSLENNGGFSSIRTRDQRFDLSGTNGITLRVRGDGRTYQLRLSTEALYQGSRISYRADFPTKAGEWIEVSVPFSKMTPGWRGQELKGPALDLSQITEVGILLGDKRSGDFQLEVDWLKSYSTP